MESVPGGMLAASTGASFRCSCGRVRLLPSRVRDEFARKTKDLPAQMKAVGMWYAHPLLDQTHQWHLALYDF